MEQKLKVANQVAQLKDLGYNPDEIIAAMNKHDLRSVEDLEKLLNMRDGLIKRSQKALAKRKELGEADYGLINQLGPIVGSRGNRDVTFAGWASTYPSAESYIKEKKKKGWSVSERDLDNDGEKEVLVLDKDGIVRRVNGWGVKESSRPIRDNYFSKNPTIADHKNITQGEWTRGVAVNQDGDIGYMFPNAVRYKKTRQEYYKQNPGKLHVAGAKQVWQQHIAKRFVHMIKDLHEDQFVGLNSLPGLAVAALSQQFSTHGYNYLKLALIVRNNQSPYYQEAGQFMQMISKGDFADIAYEDDRKRMNKKLKEWYKIPEIVGVLNQQVVQLADEMANGDALKSINSEGTLWQVYYALLLSIFDYIIDEYG